eukprot:TRINITY_DN6437_c0_g1_i2.p1 TRINITY_DN6437_c0_g1~~TRINITY_DN6437_c0_g1_i2.p1  ORF type:complete len:461 (-),score=169.07 TRINITY_DN6437_c0_g1_i2:116-1498(-)
MKLRISCLLGAVCLLKIFIDTSNALPSNVQLRHSLAPVAFASSLNQNCTSCGKNGYTCCDDEICCQDGCCTGGETCCPDKQHGSVCCLEETTFCCAPTDVLPSRCCPRWMVCCPTGRYGCCDPATGLPPSDDPDAPRLTAPTAAYSVYLDSSTQLSAMTIDTSSGKRTQVSVPGFATYGEIVRVFTYDPTNNLFYLPQANFLTNTTVTNITLNVVDPVSGWWTAQTITGAVEDGVNDVAGFEFNPRTGLMVMSTIVTDDSDNVLGYNFYNVDPTSAEATLINTYRSDNDTYVGWFGALSTDGTTVYRLGYQDVYDSTVFGLGVTNITGPTVTSVWHADLPGVSGLGPYASLNVYGDGFLSLAPSTRTGDYSLVKWQLDGTASVIATFSNAYNVPIFGYIAEYINVEQNYYAALVVRMTEPGTLDRWVLLTVDLTTNKSQELDLTPDMLAKLTSVAGLGFP